MVLDPFVRDKGYYTVKSIYFDDKYLSDYWEKVNGYSIRKKVRFRTYNNYSPESVVFFEIKRKFEIPSMKNRAKYNISQAINFFENPNLVFCQDDEELNMFFYHIKSRNLKAIVNIIYDREPFQEKIDSANNLRITFDKNLRSVAYPNIRDIHNEKNSKIIMNHYFILEIKFNVYFPYWVRGIIEKLYLKKEPASKYTLSIDSQDIIRNDTFITHYRAKRF